MEDYKQLMKDLFLRYYSPMGDDFQKKYLSTFEVLVMFRGIIPNEPIGEHDVFEIMKELGFGIELQPVEDEETGQENDVFLWKLYENK